MDEEYEILEQIGQGTYGEVFKALHKPTNQLVALKKIKMDGERDGFPVTAARELKLLQQMNHPRILKLLDIQRRAEDNNTSPEKTRNVNSSSSFWIVFQWYDNDLAGIIGTARKENRHLPLEFIRHLLRQLAEGLAYLHEHGILHRDLKPSNLLVSAEGDLCIADFGLARMLPYEQEAEISEGKFHLTNRVSTLWYRAPELLLGTDFYLGEVDMWAFGCIAYELVHLQVLFASSNGSELAQVDQIFAFMQSQKISPGKLAQYPWMSAYSECCLQSEFAFKNCPDSDLEALILECLNPDPKLRITAKNAQRHPFFAKSQEAISKESFLKEPLLGMHDYVVCFEKTHAGGVD